MENLNIINLKEQFLEMYVKEATPEQLQYINMLLELADYEKINEIIEEYIHNMTNNKDLKDYDGGSGNSSKRFELYHILVLIREYKKEQDIVKKEFLRELIQMAVNRFLRPEEVKTGKSR